MSVRSKLNITVRQEFELDVAVQFISQEAHLSQNMLILNTSLIIISQIE